MSRSMVRTAPLAAAMLLGCTGAGKWSVTCGCVEIYLSVGLEVTLPNMTDPEGYTPEAFQKWFADKYRGKQVSLEDLRALGPFSNSGCADHALHQIRCTYWMWRRGDAYRGIEVTFEFRGAQTIRARYVTEGA